MGRPHSRRANAAARRTDPRANAELYPVTITAHESVASTASQHEVPPHTATNAVRNGWSGLPTWLCAGKRTTYPPERRREIAGNLFISEKTASVHVSNIMAKLEAANRTEAGAKARALGLIDCRCA